MRGWLKYKEGVKLNEMCFALVSVRYGFISGSVRDQGDLGAHQEHFLLCFIFVENCVLSHMQHCFLEGVFIYIFHISLRKSQPGKSYDTNIS